MVYCPHCGQENKKSGKFCAQCGAKLETANEESTATFSPIEVETGDEGAELGEVAVDKAALVVRKGPNIGELFPLGEGETSLGRDPDSDIFLNDITVSRRHAKISFSDGAYTIADVGSLNGTFVNRNRVESASLKYGDELQIGKFRLVFLAHKGHAGESEGMLRNG